jgi:retron-type reverse transcriptase
MNLGELILALKPLLADPSANGPEIVDLLDRHTSLSEFEVARFYVSRAIAPMLVQQASSPDPVLRVTAARGALVLSRVDASRHLRRLVKDADPIVRSHARAMVKRLGLDDVALPDTRMELRPPPRPFQLGAWNPTGWSFGLFGRRQIQLKRTGQGKVSKPSLPVVRDVPALSKLLGLSSEEAFTPLLRPGEGAGAPYVAFEIAKASGGRRTIHAPRPALKSVQRMILDTILARIPTHDACHGFTKGRSIVTNASPHVGAKLVLRVDVHDFFPSIHFRRVEGLFREYGYPPPVARMLAGLTTHRADLGDGRFAWPGALPQGAPTSPAIANVICRRLDARLTALAARAGAQYTRYADDLSFSFAREPTVGIGRFLWWVDQICQAEGFSENAKKRRIYRRHAQQRVTGLVVNDKVTVPRSERRRFRALLHRCKKEGLAAMVAEQPGLRGELAGFAAYVQMVQPELGEALAAEIRALAER